MKIYKLTKRVPGTRKENHPTVRPQKEKVTLFHCFLVLSLCHVQMANFGCHILAGKIVLPQGKPRTFGYLLFSNHRVLSEFPNK